MHETRQQMILTAIQLFQQHGYHGTTWRNLIREAGTPWGSIAHHFPGGKIELGCAAIEMGAEWVNSLINKCFESEAAASGAIVLWFHHTGLSMKAAGYRAGCPVASIALATAPQVEELSAACRRSFSRWEKTLAGKFMHIGMSTKTANSVAGLVVTLFEGGIIRARIQSSTAPLTLAGKEAAVIIDRELKSDH